MSVADEAGAVVSAAYWTNKGATAVAKGAHRKAQHVGMRYQNWRHRGAGDEPANGAQTPATAAASEPTRTLGKPRGRHWSTESTDEETTYYHHTKSTRKESR